MKRVLFDQNVPADLRSYCEGHYIRTAKEEGSDLLSNGNLLKTAEAAGFEVLVTADKRIAYQQNLKNRSIALVVLGTNHWETIESNPGPVAAAIDNAEPGGFETVVYPLPPRRSQHK